jgi:hypothetical protein
MGNELITWGDQARAVLQPGEQLLAISSVNVAYGTKSGAEPSFWETRIGQAMRKADQAMPQWEPKGWVGKTVAGVGSLAFASSPVDLPSDFPENLIGGRTCMGPAGSLARQAESAISGNSFTHLVVTPQRVAVLRMVTADRSFAHVWALPRRAVIAAKHRPRFLSRGRFGLVFEDGSWIVLSTFGAHIGSAHAKQIVGALTAGS